MAASEPIFRALGDRTRQRVLKVLSSHELSVTELAEVLDQPQSTISRHLKVLKEAGLLSERRTGTAVLNRTLPAPQGNGGAENGAGLGELRGKLLTWVGLQELDADTQQRLDAVIRSRSAESGDFFEHVGARWDQMRIDAFGEVFHLEALSWLLPGGWTVADIGTGTGYLLGPLAHRFKRVIAVDPSESMLETARTRPELKGVQNVGFHVGSLDALPLEDASVDLAIASLVLHHVAEPGAAIRELGRVIRRAGRLLLIEQEHHHHADFHARMGDRWWGFEPQTLIEQVRSKGFTEVRSCPLMLARAARRSVEGPRLFAVIATRS